MDRHHQSPLRVGEPGDRIERGADASVRGLFALTVEQLAQALHVVERFTPVNADTITYRATLTDPIVYTRPFTIEVQFNREADGELLEVACHEDNQDLQHMKDVKDAAEAATKKEN